MIVESHKNFVKKENTSKTCCNSTLYSTYVRQSNDTVKVISLTLVKEIRVNIDHVSHLVQYACLKKKKLQSFK